MKKLFLLCASCAFLRLTLLAPAVTVDHLAPTGITTTAAWLRADVTAVSTNTALTAYYGLAAGGTNPAAWAYSNLYGTVAVTGRVSVLVTNLSAGNTYYFRWYALDTATNADWSASSFFSTLANAPSNTPAMALHALMVDTNGLLKAPTNFFRANAVALDSAATSLWAQINILLTGKLDVATWTAQTNLIWSALNASLTNEPAFEAWLGTNTYARSEVVNTQVWTAAQYPSAVLTDGSRAMTGPLVVSNITANTPALTIGNWDGTAVFRLFGGQLKVTENAGLGDYFVERQGHTQDYSTISAAPWIKPDASNNYAVGDQALAGLTGGKDNVACGDYAMWNVTNCSWNNTSGDYALNQAINSDYNAASGHGAGEGMNNCGYNTVAGQYAMYYALNCWRNGAFGDYALSRAVNLSNSVAVGSFSGRSATGFRRGYFDSYGSDPNYTGDGATNDTIFIDTDGKLHLGGGPGRAENPSAGGVLRGSWGLDQHADLTNALALAGTASQPGHTQPADSITNEAAWATNGVGRISYSGNLGGTNGVYWTLNGTNYWILLSP